MKENFLHFTSDTPCMININGKNIGCIDNLSCMELDVITKTDNIYVTYDPITIQTQALPYTFLLNTNNQPSTNNKNTRIVPFPNNNYDIILTPFYFYQIIDSTVLFNGTIGKYFVSVVSDSSTKIIIYSGLNIVFSTIVPKFSAVKVEQKKSIILIHGIIDSDTYYILAIDSTDFKILYNDITHSIEETEDDAIIYKTINTMCHHAKICNINFNSKAKDEYFVYEEDQPYSNINPLLIPFAFLECIKISDEKSSKIFLSSKLASNNISNFQEYFGNIDGIYLNRHNINAHKLNYTIMSNNHFRNFNFVMDNNKINEIEELNLL